MVIVWRCGDLTWWGCDILTVWHCAMCQNVAMRQWRNVTIWQCVKVAVRQCDNVTVSCIAGSQVRRPCQISLVMRSFRTWTRLCCQWARPQTSSWRLSAVSMPQAPINYGVASINRSLKIFVSFKNIGLFCRTLLQKRPIFLSLLLIEATPYEDLASEKHHQLHTNLIKEQLSLKN